MQRDDPRDGSASPSLPSWRRMDVVGRPWSIHPVVRCYRRCSIERLLHAPLPPSAFHLVFDLANLAQNSQPAHAAKRSLSPGKFVRNGTIRINETPGRSRYASTTCIQSRIVGRDGEYRARGCGRVREAVREFARVGSMPIQRFRVV